MNFHGCLEKIEITTLKDTVEHQKEEKRISLEHKHQAPSL